MTGELEFFNHATLRDSDFMCFVSGMKNKNNKIEINCHQLQGIQTSLGRREDDGK